MEFINYFFGRLFEENILHLFIWYFNSFFNNYKMESTKSSAYKFMFISLKMRNIAMNVIFADENFQCFQSLDYEI